MAAIAAGETNVTLPVSVTLTEPLVIDKEVTINLNGKTISAESDVFHVVQGGNLTIEGDGEVTAFGQGYGLDTNPIGVCAVFADGGTVTINGGYFATTVDKNGDRNDCIYVKNGGNVVINDGTFEYTGPKSNVTDEDGDLFLLNSNDTYKGTITVNGGTFKNHAPSYEPVGSGEVVLGTGKAVYNGDIVVNTAHTGDTDVWYTVK